MYSLNRTLAILIMFIFSLSLACTEAEFGGVSKKGAKRTASEQVPDDETIMETGEPDDVWNIPEGEINENEDDNEPIIIFSEDTTGAFLTRKLEPNRKNFIWTATSTGKVKYHTLGADGKDVTTTWTGLLPGSSGSRTYVLEGGSIVVSRTGGHVYWIDPKNTTQADITAKKAANYHKVNTGGRTCVVSYKKMGSDDKMHRYLGMGYGNGYFVEVQQADTPPYAPIWSTQTAPKDAGNFNWGYSCFIDQKRLIYYSAWIRNGPGAFDIKKGVGVSPTAVAPNGSFSSTNLAAENSGPKSTSGSYAMSGDADGNVLRGSGAYTMAYDPKSKAVFVTAGGTLKVIPQKCFHKEKTCVGHASYNMAQTIGANLGPISALGDGKIAGAVRNATGHIYLVGLKDPTNLSGGLEATRIEDAGGNPYMYTDFTGATLYLSDTENKFDLLEEAGFEAEKAILGVTMTWAAQTGHGREWKDIELKVRCYKKGSTPGDYIVFDGAVEEAKSQTLLDVEGCKKGDTFDQVDVFLHQLNAGNTLMGVKKIQVSAFQ